MTKCDCEIIKKLASAGMGSANRSDPVDDFEDYYKGVTAAAKIINKIK